MTSVALFLVALALKSILACFCLWLLAALTQQLLKVISASPEKYSLKDFHQEEKPVYLKKEVTVYMDVRGVWIPTDTLYSKDPDSRHTVKVMRNKDQSLSLIVLDYSHIRELHYGDYRLISDIPGGDHIQMVKSILYEGRAPSLTR